MKLEVEKYVADAELCAIYGVIHVNSLIYANRRKLVQLLSEYRKIIKERIRTAQKFKLWHSVPVKLQAKFIQACERGDDMQAAHLLREGAQSNVLEVVSRKHPPGAAVWGMNPESLICSFSMIRELLR